MKINRKKEIALSAASLRTILSYDLKTGLFARLARQGKGHGGARKYVGIKHHSGYLYVWIGKYQYSLHRLAWLWMTGVWPNHQIDHINGVRSDNCWNNLRLATHEQNAQHRKMGRNNTSGYIGVSFCKAIAKYHSYICVDGKKMNLGFFSNAVDAAACRNIHAAYLSSSSRLNTITEWPHYPQESVS